MHFRCGMNPESVFAAETLGEIAIFRAGGGMANMGAIGRNGNRGKDLCDSQESGSNRASPAPTGYKAAGREERGSGNTKVRRVRAGFHHASYLGGQHRTNPGGLSIAMASRTDLQATEVDRTDRTRAET